MAPFHPPARAYHCVGALGGDDWLLKTLAVEGVVLSHFTVSERKGPLGCVFYGRFSVAWGRHIPEEEPCSRE